MNCSGGIPGISNTTTLEEDLERDFLGLEQQADRDQAVAALHGTYLSMPYMDVRVVRAARAIPAEDKGAGGTAEDPAPAGRRTPYPRRICLVREESDAVRERYLEGAAEACP